MGRHRGHRLAAAAGRWRGATTGSGYQLVGHLQKDHGAGPWDEWYVEFDDGRTGWLSESEGAFHLHLRGGRGGGARAGRRSTPGQRLRLRNRPFVVEERGHGRVVAAEGQLPSDVDPDAGQPTTWTPRAPGACSSRWTSARATQDPEVFLGERLKLAQLGIPPDQLRPRVRKVSLQQARCPQCNGALELRAPDQHDARGVPVLRRAAGRAARASWPSFKLLEKPDHPPHIPLGAKGTLDGVEWICIGYLVRSCTVEGTRYPWEEYLLYHPARGFTWLMESNGHWVFLKPLDAGDVSLVAAGAPPTTRAGATRPSSP